MIRSGEYMTGRYRLLAQIGKGGGGIVYLAEDLNLRKQVVIKQILNVYSGQDTYRIEVDILKRLHHPALPQVYDYLEVEDKIFTVMEYIPGNSLQEYLDAGVVFSQEQILIWARELAKVISYMHTQPYPVFHRDIKPSNIMVKPDGKLCLIDFNISQDFMQKTAVEGYSIGYASPEQMERAWKMSRKMPSHNLVIDGKTDIYSLGAVLYRLLAGYVRKTDSMKLQDLACCWRPFAVIVDKCMEISQKQRYQTADELLDALNHLEKLDENYKKFNILQHVNRIVCGLIFIIGIALIICGNSVNTREQYTNAYGAYMEAVSGHLKDSEQMGINLLNETKYQQIFNSHPEEKADVLYYLALSFLEQERYEKAIGYMKQAIEIDRENPAYYRDYASALIGANQVEEAKTALGQAVYYGLSTGEKQLIEGELYFNEENYEEALKCYEQAVEQAVTTEERGRAVTKYACALLMQGDYQKARDALFEKYNNNIDAEYSLEDGLNLSNALQEMGNIDQSSQILETMRLRYPEEYRIDLRLAFCEYEGENRKGQTLRNYTMMVSYYEEAEKKCQKSGQDIESDEEWQQLMNIVAQLRKYGWM